MRENALLRVLFRSLTIAVILRMAKSKYFAKVGFRFKSVEKLLSNITSKLLLCVVPGVL